MARAKRLEWESFLNDGFTAETAAGDYCVTHDDDEWVLHFPDIGIVVERFAASDAAMAAGQAHFDALVASLIEEEPVSQWEWLDGDQWVSVAERSPPVGVRVAMKSPSFVIAGDWTVSADAPAGDPIPWK